MKKSFDFKKARKYLASFIGYVLLAAEDGSFSPLAVPLLSANLCAGLGIFPSFCLFATPFLFSFSVPTILYGLSGGVVVAIYYAVLRKIGRKPKFELAFIILAATLPYVVLGDKANRSVRAIRAAVCLPLGFVFISAVRIFLVKGLKFRLSVDELVSAAVLVSTCSIGFIRLFSVPAYEAIALFATIAAARLLRNGFCAVIGLIAALPIFFTSGDAVALAPLGIYSLVALCFARRSRLATALSVVAAKFALWRFTDSYSSYLPFEHCLILIPIALYLFVPSSSFKKAERALSFYKDNNLGKRAINRYRTDVSGKLFEISSALDEMGSSLQILSENNASFQGRDRLADKLFVGACIECERLSDCRDNRFPSDADLEKISSLAIAKGKFNIADLPSGFAANCAHIDKVANEADKIAREHERDLLRSESVKKGRDLVLAQTKGLAEALKNMAANASKTLDPRDDLANLITENLLSVGICVPETTVFSGNEKGDEEINVLIPKKQVKNPLLLKSIAEITGYKTIIADILDLTEEFSAVTVKRAPKYDAAFAVAQRTKADKRKSGDSHSMIKIDEGKFLIALNDGMGSGEKAAATSSAAISLVETFYKVGLSSEVALSAVNKVLAFDGDDNFTALDVGVVDLFTGVADFIKIGSPYSFVVTSDAVKIIEGGSLPLGILDELNPSVCQTKLSDGDVIVFASDGVSDAFGSSSDFIDFLATQRALNPKTLADNVLEQALALDGGSAKDDMTVFCARIFERAS